MIIDFRLRPPYKSFVQMGGLFGPEGSVNLYPLNGEDAWPVPSATNPNMDVFYKEMEEAGITKGCLLGRKASTAWSGVDSADIHELCVQKPETFIGFGAIDVSDPIMESLAIVEQCKREYGFRGMVCEPGNAVPAYYADDRRLYPFYARCVELDMIVVISMSQFLGPNISYADPSRVHTVCRDFPKGKFVIAHSGYPHVISAIAAAVAEKNLWLIPDVYWTITQIPGRDLWTQGANFLQGRRILFGTAYPFRGLPQSVYEMKRLGLPEKFYNRIMYENALELLNM